MKKLSILFTATALLVLGCKDGYIDDIQPVQPGPDENAPTATIGYPSSETVLIPFTDESTNIDFEFSVTDDIEIGSITIKLNGETLETYDDFLDYRRFSGVFTKESLVLGDYTFEVIATDLDGKTTTTTREFEISNVYVAKYPGEIFYMPFEGNVYLDLLGDRTGTRVGNPSFAAGKSGRAYVGATDSYLTVPLADLKSDEFSGSFWYKLNNSPDRAGILTVSPPDITNNNRTSGFRLLREAAGGNQRIKLNVGNGSADTWFDGATANIAPGSDWVHVAFTIANDRCAVYLNGALVKEDPFTGISWANCESLTIGSGAPNFIEWNHKSDLSLIDELRFFNKALSGEEVKTIFEDN